MVEPTPSINDENWHLRQLLFQIRDKPDEAAKIANFALASYPSGQTYASYENLRDVTNAVEKGRAPVGALIAAVRAIIDPYWPCSSNQITPLDGSVKD